MKSTTPIILRTRVEALMLGGKVGEAAATLLASDELDALIESVTIAWTLEEFNDALKQLWGEDVLASVYAPDQVWGSPGIAAVRFRMGRVARFLLIADPTLGLAILGKALQAVELKPTKRNE
jgi:hypothetical protein